MKNKNEEISVAVGNGCGTFMKVAMTMIQDRDCGDENDARFADAIGHQVVKRIERIAIGVAYMEGRIPDPPCGQWRFTDHAEIAMEMSLCWSDYGDNALEWRAALHRELDEDLFKYLCDIGVETAGWYE